MSNLLRTQERITELLGTFAYQAKAHSAASRTDFNKVSEDVLVPLFRLIYNLPDLKNLNAVKKDFPAIDLADQTAKVAFQITATADSQKIKDTLETFVDKELYKDYSRLVFYIITEKKNSYPEKTFADIVKGKFDFKIDRDILDYSDLVKTCHDFQLDKASKIKRILEANFGRPEYSVFSEVQKEPFENVFLNLIEIAFPEKLFIADLAIDRDEIIENSRGALRRDDPTRTIIRHYVLEQLKLDFFSGWHLHNKKIITFHNLHEDTGFLSKIVDQGTIDSLKTESFFTINRNIDSDRENVFKTLLRKTLQEQLYRQRVEWQFEEELFIFIENGNEKKTKKSINRKKEGETIEQEQVIFKRYESWFGEKESKRAVLEKFMKLDQPDEVWYYKHKAFAARLIRIGQKWYLLVLPDWFFSYNGFKKSAYHADDLKWLKKKANTEIVFNDFRFVHYFLQNKSNSLLHSRDAKQILRFGKYVSFDNAPFLYDEAWNPPEEKKKKKKNSDEKESTATDAETSQASLFNL